VLPVPKENEDVVLLLEEFVDVAPKAGLAVLANVAVGLLLVLLAPPKLNVGVAVAVDPAVFPIPLPPKLNVVLAPEADELAGLVPNPPALKELVIGVAVFVLPAAAAPPRPKEAPAAPNPNPVVVVLLVPKPPPDPVFVDPVLKEKVGAGDAALLAPPKE